MVIYTLPSSHLNDLNSGKLTSHTHSVSTQHQIDHYDHIFHFIVLKSLHNFCLWFQNQSWWIQCWCRCMKQQNISRNVRKRLSKIPNQMEMNKIMKAYQSGWFYNYGKFDGWVCKFVCCFYELLKNSSFNLLCCCGFLRIS